MKYRLLSSDKSLDLEERVNVLIADGYMPYGNPYCVPPIHTAMPYGHFQAMIKHAEVPQRKKREWPEIKPQDHESDHDHPF